MLTLQCEYEIYKKKQFTELFFHKKSEIVKELKRHGGLIIYLSWEGGGMLSTPPSPRKKTLE